MPGTIPEQVKVLLVPVSGCGQLSAKTEGPWWGPSPQPCPAELLTHSQPAGSSPLSGHLQHMEITTARKCTFIGKSGGMPSRYLSMPLQTPPHREGLSCTSISATAELGHYTVFVTVPLQETGLLVKPTKTVKVKAEIVQDFWGGGGSLALWKNHSVI